MKTSVCLASLGIVSVMAAVAHSETGEVSQPGLAFPTDYAEVSKTEITTALRHPDSQFLGGQFLNSFTSLRYAGDTLALNLFLDGLARCPGAVVAVRFAKDRIPDDCDWLVSHFAGDPRRITVRVNLQSSRIKLEELVVPEANGPPLPEPQ